ncbi:MAG: hypothetical protein M1816_007408 [Peltula sp. TS41687]|nr:MAG: hypothetical protein M1816_007408 [Peltula sp. TS41687]
MDESPVEKTSLEGPGLWVLPYLAPVKASARWWDASLEYSPASCPGSSALQNRRFQYPQLDWNGPQSDAPDAQWADDSGVA